ncbi:MAG: hypothetical protein RR207_01345 [Clostridia bacterium]
MLFLIIFGLYITQSNIYILTFLDGLTIWIKAVVPVLLPFMIISKIALNYGIFDKLKGEIIFKKLFSAPKIALSVFLPSLLCGYPLGAKLVSELYSTRQADTALCYKLLTFCSLPSPIFTIVTVGCVMLNSLEIGIIVYISCILSNTMCGIVLKKAFVCQQLPTLQLKKVTATNIMTDSIMSTLSVGSYIAVFALLQELIYQITTTLIPNININMFNIFCGLIEMSRGCSKVAQFSPLLASCICAFYVGFGGLCVFAQSYSYYKKCRLNGGIMLAIKLLQGAFACIFCLLIIVIF